MTFLRFSECLISAHNRFLALSFIVVFPLPTLLLDMNKYIQDFEGIILFLHLGDSGKFLNYRHDRMLLSKASDISSVAWRRVPPRRY